MTPYIGRNEIEAQADALRDSAGLLEAPIQANLAAEYLGITVQYENFSDDLSGALIRKEGYSVIAVNRAHSDTRKAFTIAHEVGHAVLKHEGDIFVDKAFINKRDLTSSMAVNAQEIQANQFAASLLMPKSLLLKKFSAVSVAMNNRQELIASLAKKFAVSKKAMEYRLVNLAFISAPDDSEDE
jgi:Zn-dependent peptidase ImmA (M78 family)